MADSAPLTTSIATVGSTWAVVVMGDPASQSGAFWQLVTLPHGSTQWALVTPPGVADNGGLVAAADPSAGPLLRVAFRPSQNLTFSPLASTSNALSKSTLKPTEDDKASIGKKRTGGGEEGR